MGVTRQELHNAERIYDMAAALYSDLGGDKNEKLMIATTLVAMVIARDFPAGDELVFVSEHMGALMRCPFNDLRDRK